MALSVGTKLGPYEILAPLGAGGMGEVYRAKDTRLGRDVAIKVLPPHLSASPELRERFEREARAISSLNHARICTLHDVGHQDGIDFLVMEYLEGESLAQRLRRGALPLKETLKIGMEVCEALDVAHRTGIVHRDLKPANVMLTKSGAKLMDFGLAKSSAAGGGGSGTAPLLSAAETISGPSPMSPLTGVGQVIGTIQYMSPEQIEGKEADARSDLFALGAVLYEMATGKRPFEGKSQISVASAILEKEPEPVSKLQPLTTPLFEHVVNTCLQKNPEERLQSACDARLELKWIAESAPSSGGEAAPAARKKWLGVLPWALAGAMLLAGILGAWLYRQSVTGRVAPTYQQLTFERGFVYAARFAADGESVYYSADWNGEPLQIYATIPGSPESRPLNLANSTLFSANASNLAISLGCKDRFLGNCQGMLAVVPVSGSAPKEIEDGVYGADWTADGSQMAVIREQGGKFQLEFPRGKKIYESEKALACLRIAPDGKAVAFTEYIALNNDVGAAVVLSANGKEVVRSRQFESLEGLAWSPSGDELWIGATENRGFANMIFGLHTNGTERLLLRLPGILRLHDVSRNGKILLSMESWRTEVQYRREGETKEKVLSWLDFAAVRDISPDGKEILFQDWGAAAGAEPLAYMRQTDGSSPVKLGEWAGPVLSPDGKRALAASSGLDGIARLAVLPIGAGETEIINTPGIQQSSAWGWMPTGSEIYFSGNDGHGWRMYVQDVSGGTRRAVSDSISVVPHFESRLVSPDGRYIFARDLGGKAQLYPVAGGAPKVVAGWLPEDIWIVWSSDGRTAYVYHDEKTKAPVFRLDLETGKRELVTTLSPDDRAGVSAIANVRMTADGKAVAYSYNRELSNLFLVDGVR